MQNLGYLEGLLMPEINEDQQYQKAVEQLDAKIEVSSPPKTASWVIVLFLLLFPPVAFYLLWKDKAYHGWFYSLNIFFGISLVVFGIFMKVFLIPLLTKAFSTVGAKQPGSSSALIIILIVFAIFQICFGFYLKNKRNPDGSLSVGYRTICIVLFLVDYVIPMWFYSSILSLTTQTSQFLGL